MASCHSPHQNRYNRLGISQVHWLDCRVADLGYCARAVEPSSQPSVGFSVPKCWAFCTRRVSVKCTQPTMERGLRGWVKMTWGAECCSQALSSQGQCPMPQKRGRPQRITAMGHNLHSLCCPSFSATYVVEATEGIKTSHFNCSYFLMKVSNIKLQKVMTPST